MQKAFIPINFIYQKWAVFGQKQKWHQNDFRPESETKIIMHFRPNAKLRTNINNLPQCDINGHNYQNDRLQSYNVPIQSSAVLLIFKL